MQIDALSLSPFSSDHAIQPQGAEGAAKSNPIAPVVSPAGLWGSLTDRAQISPLGALLAGTGLNASRSMAVQEASAFRFDLNFESSSLMRMNASGLYAEESQRLDLSMSFTFEREVWVDGRYEMRSFQAEMSLSLSTQKSASFTPYRRKEDIMDLAKRLIQDIWETVGDPDKQLEGIVLDKEDFLDLSGVEDGKLVKALVALVQAIQFAARLQEMIHGPQDKEHVLLHPQRQVEEGIEVEAMEHSLLDFNLSVTEITAAYSEAEEDIPAAESESPAQESLLAA